MLWEESTIRTEMPDDIGAFPDDISPFPDEIGTLSIAVASEMIPFASFPDDIGTFGSLLASFSVQ